MNLGARGQRSVFVSSASGTPRSDRTQNQDKYSVWRAERYNHIAVALADGVGSWENSGVLATGVADAACEAMRLSQNSPIDAAFSGAHRVASRFQDPAGTTLIVASAKGGSLLQCGYVGNGGILEVVFPGGAVAPLWTNHLVPDITYLTSREAMDRCFVSKESTPPRAHKLTLSLGDRPSSVLLVTDGVYTLEQQHVADTSDGRKWLLESETVKSLVNVAGNSIRMIESGLVDELALSIALKSELDRLVTSDEIDDDATVIQILFGPVIH